MIHNDLIALVESAGRNLLEVRGRMQQGLDIGVQVKADGSRVSEADLSTNELLLDGLGSIYPGLPVVSEEGPIVNSAYSAELGIIMDPLDGTNSFLDGRDDFSVLLGFLKNGKLFQGVMLFPVWSLLATAQAGCGALVDGVAARVSARTRLCEGRVSLHKCSSEHPFVVPDVLDSGFALLELARGRVDGVVIKMKSHREWDLVAPTVVVQEAGGRVSDETGGTLDFSQKGIAYEYFIASNGHCHGELVEWVRHEGL